MLLSSLRVLGLTLLLGSSYAMAAGPHHEACLPAADYAGCIKALAEADAARSNGSTTTIKIDQTNRPGLLSEVGNDCPSGMAYAGAYGGMPAPPPNAVWDCLPLVQKKLIPNP